jgi:hypothetical protein
MEKTITIKCKNIIETLGLESLSTKEKDNLIGQMVNIIFDKIILRVMEKINEEEASELNGYIESGDMNKVNNFLKEKVSNFSSIIQEELDNLEKEIVKRYNIK